MTPEEIAEARAVCEARTKGEAVAEGTRLLIRTYGRAPSSAPFLPVDAAFFASAWRGWPAALDALEEAKEEVARLQWLATESHRIAGEVTVAQAREAQVETELREALDALRAVVALTGDESLEEQDAAWGTAAALVALHDEEGA